MSKVFDQARPRFSFWLKVNFRKIASNEQVEWRKIENFVISKCYPDHVLKDKGKKANFRKTSKNFKIVDGNLRWYLERMIFGNDIKLQIPQYHSILP